ncbi:DUF5776 domain-containing protein [Lentilactobacillus kisonensis]|uniref:DUF5776 domain-containing protein n=1 Tax=Lentilactobacillus kisonensis TaxID=481722 RepID=UPI0034E24219
MSIPNQPLVKLIVRLTLKKGTIVKVKKLVKQGSLSKFVLTNGHYLTANKKLIIAQP